MMALTAGINALAEGATIDTSGVVAGLTNGTNTMLTTFLGMIGDVLPIALPILGITVGIGFFIKLVKKFMH